MNVLYRAASPSDHPQLISLWEKVFEEPREAVELFFERNLSIHGYLAQYDNSPIAAVYLTDATLNGQQAHYLCGAATLPEFRCRGVMSELIEYALNDAKSRGDSYSLLFPANEGLYRFYERLSYRAVCQNAVLRLSRGELAADSAEPKSTTDAPDYEAMQRACLKDDFLLQNNNFISFAIEYYRFYGTHTIATPRCLAFWEEENGIADVFYSIYYDIKELKYLLLRHSTAREFVFHGKNGEPRSRSGMLRVLTSSDGEYPRPYIGITLQ